VWVGAKKRDSKSNKETGRKEERKKGRKKERKWSMPEISA
jgi:hypothetical protein